MTYTVLAGEGFYAVAAKLFPDLPRHATAVAIAAANGLTIDDTIHPGQVLTIPPLADTDQPAPLTEADVQRIAAVMDTPIRTQQDLQGATLNAHTVALDQLRQADSTIAAALSTVAADQADVNDATRAALDTLDAQVAQLEQTPPPPAGGLDEAEVRAIVTSMLPTAGALARFTAMFAGVLYVDDYTGDDSARIAAMLAAQAARPGSLTPQGWLAPRRHNLTRTQNLGTYANLSGPPGAGGDRSFELDNGRGVNHELRLGGSIGVGNAAAFVAPATTNHVTMSRLCVRGTGTQQFLAGSVGNGVYPSHIHGLAAYNLRHVLGSPSAPMLVTGLNIDGPLDFHAGTDTALSLRGSDLNLAPSLCNLEYSAGGDGKYLAIFNLHKSDIGPGFFLTPTANWRGVWLGPDCDEVDWWGGKYEGHGQSYTTPGAHSQAAFGTVLRLSGRATLNGVKVNQGMANPGAVNPASPDRGVIFQDGGDNHLIGVWYKPANGAPTSSGATHPFVYHQAGRMVIERARGWAGFRPTVVTLRPDLLDADDSVDIIDARP